MMHKAVKKFYGTASSSALMTSAAAGGGGGDVGPWAKAQSGFHANGATSSTTVAVTLANPVGSGNLVCIAVSSGNSAASCVLTDDKGNTYPSAVDSSTMLDSTFTTFIFYLLNITNGPKTFTATFNSARQYSSIIVDEFSGAEATASLDKHTIQSQVGPGTTTDNVTSGSQTTTANGELIWGYSMDLFSEGLATGTGYTQAQYQNTTYLTEYLVQATAGAVAATFTATNAASQTTSAMLAFKKS